MPDPIPTFELPADLGQALLQYLVTRPYAEVAPFINGLQNLKEIQGDGQALTAPPENTVTIDTVTAEQLQELDPAVRMAVEAQARANGVELPVWMDEEDDKPAAKKAAAKKPAAKRSTAKRSSRTKR